MTKRDPLLLQAIQLLSMRVAGKEEFFSLTSCLNEEEREIIGYCKAFTSLFPEDPLSKQLNEEFIPAIRYIGLAKWHRTELTHLGGFLGSSDTEEIDIEEEDLSLSVEAGESEE